MARKRRTYTAEFKQEAVEMSRNSGRSVAQIERELGLPQGLLYKWRRKHRVDGEPSPLPDKG